MLKSRHGARWYHVNFTVFCTVEPLRYGHLPQPGSRFALFYANIAEIVGSTSMYVHCILRYGQI